MLNWAARYYPIVRILKAQGLFDSASLLEIGSGPFGIGRFRKVPFVGCDLSFSSKPAWPMAPVVASATQLPFQDREFDVVLASDVLEHIPVDLRRTVIGESLRVARKFAIFGFPCGRQAWDADKALLDAYSQNEVPAPEWLTEHMEAQFPEPELMEEVSGWEVSRQGNENIEFHSRLMRAEMSSSMFVRMSSAAMWVAPALVEALLKRADREGPFYRQIFALRRLDDVPTQAPDARRVSVQGLSVG